MPKVTVIVETDDQHTTVSREGNNDPGLLLAQCIHRVAGTYNDSRLDEIAKAVEEAVRHRYTRRTR